MKKSDEALEDLIEFCVESGMERSDAENALKAVYHVGYVAGQRNIVQHLMMSTAQKAAAS